jgi:NADH-quinone oxidoreductase subunit L
MTHAFFKALLFLAAGIVIQALHHEHNIFKMGGLRKELPAAFWTFLIGGCSLAGLPLITAGFYSKGLIIWETMASEGGSTGLWVAAVAGVLITSLYTFRVIFLVFFGEPKSHIGERPGYLMTVPAVVLAFLSIVGGFVNTPAALGTVHSLTDLMNRALPPIAGRGGLQMTEMGSEGIVTLAFLAGLIAAYFLFLKRPGFGAALTRPAAGGMLHAFWFAGWGFDWLYDRVFVRPIVWIARIDKGDFVDTFYTGVARANELFHSALSHTENGRVRWYAAGIAAGSIIFVAIAVFA